MKKTLISLSLLCLFGVVSCTGSDKGKQLSEISNATPEDSLSYYYGSMYAADYWMNASRDTTLKSEEARRKYLEGIRKGLEMVSDDEAYNTGVLTGVQMAMESRQFLNDFGAKLNTDVLLKGMAYGLRSDTAADVRTAQYYIQSSVQRLGEQKLQADQAESLKVLAKMGPAKKMAKVADNLYEEVITPGAEPLREGQEVKVKCQIFDSAGRQMDLNFPEDAVVGNYVPESVINAALSHMKMGGKAKFLSTATYVFGPNCMRMKIEPQELIYITMTVAGPKEAAALKGDAPKLTQ